jgi:hypothetical protein
MASCINRKLIVAYKGISRTTSYAPVLKATEACLPVAIAAHYGAELYGTETKQVFLYGNNTGR